MSTVNFSFFSIIHFLASILLNNEALFFLIRGALITGINLFLGGTDVRNRTGRFCQGILSKKMIKGNLRIRVKHKKSGRRVVNNLTLFFC